MSRRFGRLLLFGVLPVFACTGTGRIIDPDDRMGGGGMGGMVPGPLPPTAPECMNAPVRPGPSPIRRLTRAEYNNTVRDLLDDNSEPANRFAEEELGLGFSNNAVVQSVSGLLIEQYETAAANLAAAATSNLPRLLGCDPATRGEDACVRDFLGNFGMRAYRRPLAPAERDRLFGFYMTSKAAHDFRSGVSMTVQAMLQSPDFLYRLETGTATVSGSVARLSGYEMASRLSYMLWATMPDAALFEAAAAGKLDRAEGVREQARRMVDDPRAKQAVNLFQSQWLELDKIGSAQKDGGLFPRFTPVLRALLRKELELLVSDVMLNSGGARSLFDADYTFMNKDLAAYYGVRGPAGEAFEKVMLDQKKYLGVLTRAGILAANAKADQTSPVLRGFFVRERLMCAPPPPPPATVNTTPPAPDPSSTTRDRFARHRADPACASCHQLMDPVGFGFEHYDAVGRWRDTDGGKAIDASGEIIGSQDADGRFDGAVELSTRLGKSPQVRACLVTQWFRFGYGRSEIDDDRCTLGALNAAFSTKGDFKDLLVALTQTDVFLHRTAEKGSP